VRLPLREGAAVPELIDPPDGRRFVGAGVAGDGRFVLAVEQEGGIALRIGFGQGRWRSGPVLPLAAAEGDGPLIGPVIGAPGFWVIDGGTVMLVDGSDGALASPRVRAADRLVPAGVPRKDRVAGLGGPVALRAAGSDRQHLYLPVGDAGQPRLAAMPLGHDGATLVLQDGPGTSGFIAPSPDDGGVMVGRAGGVDLYEAGDLRWSLRVDDTVAAAPVRCGTAAFCLTDVSGAAAGATGKRAKLTVHSIDPGQREARQRLGMLAIAGTPAPGFGPLMVGQRLVYATNTDAGLRVRSIDPFTPGSGGSP